MVPLRTEWAFSKKWENLKAALALHFAYYNFCRIHGKLRVTPAMEAGIADHVWNHRGAYRVGKEKRGLIAMAKKGIIWLKDLTGVKTRMGVEKDGTIIAQFRFPAETTDKLRERLKKRERQKKKSSPR